LNSGANTIFLKSNHFLSAVKTKFQSYYDTNYTSGGVNLMWILRICEGTFNQGPSYSILFSTLQEKLEDTKGAIRNSKARQNIVQREKELKDKNLQNITQKIKD
jgi:hypothetical protein